MYFRIFCKENLPLDDLIGVKTKERLENSQKGAPVDSLVQRAKKQEQAAFVELIRIHTVSMYQVAKAILKNDDDAADAIQETILTCWEKIGTLKKDEYFKTWLTRILINHCNTIYRQRKRVVAKETLPESGKMEEQYTTIEWQEFLQGLEEKYRIVAMLYYVEGFKIREIAKILQINENTVGTRLSAARKKMEQQYQKRPSKIRRII